MLLQPLPKTKTSASKRLQHLECTDGQSPVLSACGAKTGAATLAVEVGNNQMNRRPVRLRQPQPLRLQEVKVKVHVARCCGPEGNTRVVPFSTVSLGVLSIQSPARRVSACARRCRAFGGEKVWPNPSVKRTRNGVAPGPRGRVVYPRPHGPGATPSRAAYLER